MDLKHLRLIIAIDDCGSLTLAGDKLHLTQSALSHQLKELENSLGVRVYHRINKKLVPTSAGMKLIERARMIMQDYESMVFDIKSINSGGSGEIKLCMECYSNYIWLPELLKKFNAIYPNVGIEINSGNTHEPIEQLLSCKADLAIVVAQDDNPLIEFSALFEDELVAIIPSNHQFAANDFVTIEDIQSQPLITHSGEGKLDKVFENTISIKEFAPEKVFHIGITEAVVDMVKSGFGIAVVSEWATRSYRQNKNILSKRISKNGLFKYWYMATLKIEDNSPYKMAFIKMLRQQLQNNLIPQVQ